MGHGFLSGLIRGSLLSVVVLAIISLLMPLRETTTPAAVSVAPTSAGAPVSAPVEPVAAPVTRPARPQPSGLARPADETLPTAAVATATETIAPDVGGSDQTGTGTSTGTVASVVSVPAGSEFRRALPETVARLPVAAAVPDAAVAPVAPQVEAAHDGPAIPSTMSTSRPDTPGLSVSAPVAPRDDLGSVGALNGTDSGGVAVPRASKTTVPVQPDAAPDPTAGRTLPPAIRLAPVDEGRRILPDAPAATAVASHQAPVRVAPADVGRAVAVKALEGGMGISVVVRSLPPATTPPATTADSVATLAAIERIDPEIVTDLRGARPPSASVAAAADRTTRQAVVPPNLAPATPPRRTPLADAIARNAVQFANPDSDPLLSVILVLQPHDEVAPTQLASLPLPVSVALDRGDPATTSLAEKFSDAGIEVLLLASDLPATGGGSLAGAILRDALESVPQALAIMDPETRRFSRTERLADAVRTVAAEQGHGVVGWADLNSALVQQVELPALPTVLIFGALDAAGEGSVRMQRYLDRAAYEAVETGSAVMVGHARPETLDALRQWSDSSAATTVAVAPISAVLRNQSALLH